MFNKWTGKEVRRFVVCLIVYLLLALAVAFTGLAGPVFWIIIYPIIAAFVEAGPITCVMSMKRGFGSAAVLPLILFILSALIGELSMPLMIVWIVAIIILAEVIHMAVGCEKRSSIRAAVPVASLMAVAQAFPIYFTKEAYLDRAALEMSSDYVEGLSHLGSMPMLVLTVVLCIAAASVSERITEKILKIAAMT